MRAERIRVLFHRRIAWQDQCESVDLPARVVESRYTFGTLEDWIRTGQDQSSLSAKEMAFCENYLSTLAQCRQG